MSRLGVGLWLGAALLVSLPAAAAEPESAEAPKSPPSPGSTDGDSEAASGGTGADLLAAIEALLAEGDTAAAAERCNEALDAAGLRLETFRALHLRCVEALAAEKSDEAVEVAKLALALAPGATAPDGAPKRVRKAFKAAAEFWAENIPFEIHHPAPPVPEPGADVELTAKVESDPLGLVDHWVLVVRPVGATTTERMIGRPESRPDSVRFVIPYATTSTGRDGRVEYVLQAVNAAGSVVAEIGSLDAPRVVAVSPPPEEPPAGVAPAAASEPPPATKKARSRSGARTWWAWVVVGAVVAAGAATGTYFLAARASSGATLQFSYEVTSP